jgi:hypothetical protein
MTGTQPDYLILDTIPAPLGAFRIATDQDRLRRRPAPQALAAHPRGRGLEGEPRQEAPAAGAGLRPGERGLGS